MIFPIDNFFHLCHILADKEKTVAVLDCFYYYCFQKKLAEYFYNDKEVMLSQEGSREQVVGSLERGKCFPAVRFSFSVGKDVEGFKDFTCKEGERR